MKKISITLLMLTGIMATVFAQQADKTSVESRANYDLDRAKAIFEDNEDLALSAEQEAQLLEVYQTKYNCFQEARAVAEKEEIRKQMRACNQAANQAFQETLSDEQLSFYREKQREKRTEALKKMKGKADREISYLKEILTEDLTLTEEQEAAIQKVYEEEQEAFDPTDFDHLLSPVGSPAGAI